MKTKIGDKVYEYENMILESIKIPLNLRDEINKFCKDKNIIKSKLIEHFYTEILTRVVSGDLNLTNGFLTINIFDKKLMKKYKAKTI